METSSSQGGMLKRRLLRHLNLEDLESWLKRNPKRWMRPQTTASKYVLGNYTSLPRRLPPAAQHLAHERTYADTPLKVVEIFFNSFLESRMKVHHMIDPLSTVTAVAGLVGSTLKGIQTINNYHGLYSRSAITIASMTAQCSCVEFALLQVQETILNNPQSAFRLRSDSALAKHFSSVFGACQLVFSILDQRLRDLVDDRLNQYGEVSTMGKIKQVWNEQDMKDLLSNIESQASAINLLLGALQMGSNAEIHNLLTKRESQKLLDRVSNDASSLRSAEDTRIRMSTVTPSLNSTFDDIEFAFDYELINTTTYRKAFISASRQNITQPKVSNDEDNIAPPSKQGLFLEMVTEEGEKVEELVIDGTEKLSIKDRNSTESAVSFTPLQQQLPAIAGSRDVSAPPKTTGTTLPRMHPYQVVNIDSTFSKSLNRSPVTKQYESSTILDSENYMVDIIKGLEDMMFSSFEDIVPNFMSNHQKPLTDVFTVEGNTFLNDRLLVNDNSASRFDTSMPEGPQSTTFQITQSTETRFPTTLDSISMPETIKTSSPSSPTLSDPAELSLELVSLELPARGYEFEFENHVGPLEEKTAIPEETAEKASLEGGTGVVTAPVKVTWSVEESLQGFLEYISTTRLVDPFFTSSGLNASSNVRVQRSLNILPQGKPYILAHSDTRSIGLEREDLSLVSYLPEEIIHSTASSMVIKGRKAGVSDTFAIKIMSRAPSIGLRPGQDRLRSIHLEVAILHDLSHENIVRIHELIELEMQVVIIMSHASSTTLLQYIQEKRRFTGGWFFPENIAWSIFRQLVSGVMYLHDHQTIHHNLTLDNILFDTSRERIVIKGFNIAEIVSRGDTFFGRPKFINPYFTAPEVLAGSQGLLAAESVYEAGKVDVFSCGVILFTMLKGVMPYSGNMFLTQFGPFHANKHLKELARTPISQAYLIRKGDACTNSLLRALLEYNPKPRYNIRQTSSHAWMLARPLTNPSSSIAERNYFDAGISILD